MDELRNAARTCSNMQQLDALFINLSRDDPNLVFQREARRIYCESAERLTGDGQTGEVLEECDI